MTEYMEWKVKLLRLNDHINSLKTWNGYAEDCQREYDFLLQNEPEKTKEEKEVDNERK